MGIAETSLSPLQVELLKAFSMQSVEEEDILEIRNILSMYFANKARTLALKLAMSKEWTAADIEDLQFGHERLKAK